MSHWLRTPSGVKSACFFSASRLSFTALVYASFGSSTVYRNTSSIRSAARAAESGLPSACAWLIARVSFLRDSRGAFSL